MKPTEILSSEHRVIEQVLDCLEQIATRARDQSLLDQESARQALRFVRTFADACHHAKEESQLFPMLNRRGIPRHVGPLAVMLEEHEEGRAFVRRMAEALARASTGERGAPADFADAALGYVALLREHIAKEDNVLFPMAEACLREADRVEVLAGFDLAESQEVGPGVHQEMLALAETLAQRFDVPRASERAISAISGCGHHGGGRGCEH